MLRAAPLLLLALAAAPALAQQAPPPPLVEVPGRQIVEADGVLVEVHYASTSVRVRLYDLEGQPLELSGLWLDRSTIGLVSERGLVHMTASRAVRLVTPPGGGLPYLEATHGLGALADQDRLVVSVRLKNVGGAGDRTFLASAAWERVEHRACCAGDGWPACRGADTCRLCARRLCRPRR